MTVIELGDPGSPTTPGPPGRRRLPPHAVVRAAAVAVTALCLATVAASARPARTVTGPGWSVAVGRTSSVRVSPGAVFVLSPGQKLTAYDLATGRVRWSTPLPMSHGPLAVSEPGALLVPTGPPGATAAVDARTGTRMWQRPGDVLDTTTGTALLAGPGATARLVSMADGTEIWSATLDEAAGRVVADHGRPAARLVSVAGGGQMQTIRLADGAVLARGRLRDDGVVVKDGVGASGGLLYVNRLQSDRAAVTAYDLGTLAPRWRFAQDASDDVQTRPAARPCGPVWCFRDGTATAGLDVGSGGVRWRAGGWIDAVPAAAGTRLLAASADQAEHSLLDSSTGRIVVALGAGTPVWDDARTTPVFYLRAAGPSDARTSVSRIDTATGALAVRGLIGPVDGRRCTAAGGTLVCVTPDGRLTVTALG